MPIGFRRAMIGVREHQLLLARERKVLQDLELEVSHQVSGAVRDIDHNFGITQSNFNRRVAAEDEVAAFEAVYGSGRVTLDVLLDAQRRRAEAESAYFRSLVDYNRAIMRIHYRKGSLLEYNGVYLAEGPWPGKAQFDALRRARERDASTFLDYGFTRPGVISRGAYAQGGYEIDSSSVLPTPVDAGPDLHESAPHENGPVDEVLPQLEVIPTPAEVQLNTTTFQQQTTEGTNPSSVALVNFPVPAEETPAVVPAISAANVPRQSPVTIESAATLQPNPVDTNAAPLHTNPYRQEMKTWMDSTTGGLPGGSTGVNPLRPSHNAQFSTTWTADRPAVNEPQAHHSTAEVAPNSSVWPGAKR